MRAGMNRDAWDSAVRKSYAQRNKNSSGVRTLEEIKSEMSYWEDEQKNISDQLFEEQGGFRAFTADKEKVKQLEEGMDHARKEYKHVEEEYENHPDYYEDKYWYDSGFEKAAKGIVNSVVATVPVIWETIKSNRNANKEYYKDNPGKLNYFDVDPNAYWNEESDPGYFDVDPAGFAADPQPGIEAYQKPVDMDSKAMELMEEAAWLKNSATENLNGFWKPVADTAIDIGQNVALTPLLLGGVGAYTAGVAANAAAEDMYAQTAKGKKASRALGSGLLTAGVEVVGSKLADIENPNAKVTARQVYEAIKDRDVEAIKDLGKNLIKNTKFEFTREGALYLVDYLADKVWRNPDAEFDLVEFIQSAVSNKISGFTEKRANSLFKALDKAWEIFD